MHACLAPQKAAILKNTNSVPLSDQNRPKVPATDHVRIRENIHDIIAFFTD